MTVNTLGPWGFAVDKDGLDEASAIEDLGFGTLWLAGGQLDRLARLTDLLAVTQRAVIGSSIISADVHPAREVVRLYRRAESEHPGRLLVGLGGPQRPATVAAFEQYLDQLDEIPRERRILAAIGPGGSRWRDAEPTGRCPSW
jgi:alkanesulfonate monooxygenase SsuD/methylene tetrahydromethanopterin reductase-like flavin-dependent oxidoreductase (luciferase family)